MRARLDWVEAGQVPNGFGSVPLRLVGRKQYPTRGAFEAYDRIACATRSHTHEKLLRRSDFGQAIEDLLGTGKGSLTVMEIRNELRNTTYPNLQNIDVITAVLKPKH